MSDFYNPIVTKVSEEAYLRATVDSRDTRITFRGKQVATYCQWAIYQSGTRLINADATDSFPVVCWAVNTQINEPPVVGRSVAGLMAMLEQR